MTLTAFILVLAVVGVVLLAAELALPAHGTLAILGLASIAGAIAACFAVSLRTGTVVLVAAMVLTPLVGAAFAQLWPRTPLGRRLVLSAAPPVAPVPGVVPPAVVVGMTGTTVSELRPMGTCEFGDTRTEVTAERGTVAPGTRVRVVAVTNGRPTVRVV